MGIRLKVARVIKHRAFKSAFLKTNPFKLNAKDRQQLRAYMIAYDKLFINFEGS